MTPICAKKLLNGVGVTKHKRHRVDGLRLFSIKSDEFRAYLKDYGVANTVYEIPYDRKEQFRIIAGSGSGPGPIRFSFFRFLLRRGMS